MTTALRAQFGNTPRAPRRNVSAPAGTFTTPRSNKLPLLLDDDNHDVADAAAGQLSSPQPEDNDKKLMLEPYYYEEFARRLPVLKKLTEHVRRIPPKYKYACFLCWIAYKLVTVVVFVVLVVMHNNRHVRNSVTSTTITAATALSENHHSSEQQPSTTQTTKILYIVTSLAEYNNGRRNTVAGQDRLAEVVLPILVDSVESMTTVTTQNPLYNFQVDVFLILAYTLRPEREQLIRDRLPAHVALQVWDDACPLGYDRRTTVEENTRALARQHRYVIKDKLPYYDLFVAFEDDMRITGAHVQHYLDVSEALELLKQQQQQQSAAVDVDVQPQTASSDAGAFFGPMTTRQLDRLVPGFVRVEVLLNENEHGAQQKLDPVPLDYYLDDDDKKGQEVHFDARPCCHVQMHPNKETPAHPNSADVVIWETSVKALAVRRLPTVPVPVTPTASTKARTNNSLDWVTLLPGPGKRLTPEDLISSFWSGRLSNGAWETKPSPGQPDLIAQQGGWMATKQQILRWNQQGGDDDQHPQLCQGTFLPPFDEPIYRRDGQESMNVEFWSGGYQLFTGVKGGCNMMRVVSMHPDHFSKHFIYHVANNKQKQLAQNRMVRADHLWAQLNSVRKAAEKEQERLLQTVKGVATTA